MSVDPIRAGVCGYCAPLVSSFHPQAADSAQLFALVNRVPQTQPNTGLWWTQPTSSTIFDRMLLSAKSLQLQGHGIEEKVLSPTYNRIYLQYPNDSLKALANDITRGLVSDDEKATAVIRWALNNFPYELDEANYGYAEFWAPPTFALRKGSGDCEDGAFIVHSLLLHAGIPYERVRTYGGLVEAGEGAATGGHAWTAYRRELDDEWVILDTSYHPTMAPVDDRPLMRDASLYIDNFFYFNAYYWVTLQDVDRIHDPGVVYTYSSKGLAQDLLLNTGAFVDTHA
jgi:hypothetical protein